MEHHECLAYFFGICAHSQQEAQDFLYAWAIGGALGLLMVVGSAVAAWLTTD
jgi:hypothetical protein